MKLWTLALLAALMLVTAPAIAGEDPAPPTPEQLRLAQTGEVTVNIERGDVNRGEVIGIVRVPIDRVWAAIRDYDTYIAWFPDQVESRNDGSPEPGMSVIYGEIHIPVLANRRFQMVVHYGEREVDGQTHYFASYEYIPNSGNLVSSNGYWYLQPHGANNEYTILKYIVNANLGRMIPDGVERWAARNLLPGIPTNLENHLQR